MVQVHNLGFPRIGAKRELKQLLEQYWSNQISQQQLLDSAKQLRLERLKAQQNLDWVPVGDFSLYDHVLDTSVLVGNLPKRCQQDNLIDSYFQAARGQSTQGQSCAHTHAGELTKWFDTNYHFIVPELEAQTCFTLNAQWLIEQVQEAQALGVKPKPVLLGPVTYLKLCKVKNGPEALTYLDQLTQVYAQLLAKLCELGVEWVQIDEPALVLELDQPWQQAFERSYHALQHTGVKLMLTTYFGGLEDNLQLACSLPVAGLHIDAVRAPEQVKKVHDWLPKQKTLSVGVIDGRNVWAADLTKLLSWLKPLHKARKDTLFIAPSCSLLHVPVDLDLETKLDPELVSWLSFATQKLAELETLAETLDLGEPAVRFKLEENQKALHSRRSSAKVHKKEVTQRLLNLSPEHSSRRSEFSLREAVQAKRFNLPLLPTTTIGSFPQTSELRKQRNAFKKGALAESEYQDYIKQQVKDAVAFQEQLGLDVLVHGEAERTDMVEFFGQRLSGFCFTDFGWVQSYGSRCVKPPVLFGDVSRDQPLTVELARYAQSLTQKPVKGMLTGPVTLLNWSFVRDDQPKSTTCKQLALAIRDEVKELEAAGVPMIQIDEAALREGLPLHAKDQKHYLDWAVECFKISSCVVADHTQIHTHMCYSEFSEILDSIAAMDADVITIETSRSGGELLSDFERFDYPAQIGPGVYDIHSPNTPSVLDMEQVLRQALKHTKAQRLWVNPDCGLKTRNWPETKAALENMVAAAHSVRGEYAALSQSA